MNQTDQKTQDYHTAIKNVVEHLKSKRSELQHEITTDELEKAKVMGEMNKLQDRLSILNANLRKKSEFRREYDKAISQSEEHFVELLQKSEDFLSLTRREALALSTAISEPKTCPEGQTPCWEKVKQTQQKGNSTGRAAEPPCGPPSAVLMLQPPNSKDCNSCANPCPCPTIMVPYRANGL